MDITNKTQRGRLSLMHYIAESENRSEWSIIKDFFPMIHKLAIKDLVNDPNIESITVVGSNRLVIDLKKNLLEI